MSPVEVGESDLLNQSNRLVVRLAVVVTPGKAEIVPAGVQWIEFLRTAGEFDTPFEFAHERQIVADVGERFGIIGIESQGQLRLRLELGILAAEKMHNG